jgi:hypothetical protein
MNGPPDTNLPTLAPAGEILAFPSDVASAIEITRKLTEPKVIEAGTTTMLAVSAGVRVLDLTAALDARAAAPRRIEGTASITTRAAFIEHVQRFKTPNTTIFATGGDSPKLTAVIDYHGKASDAGPAAPAWGKHKITYAFPHTPSFIQWARVGAKDQKSFFSFLEQRRFDIVHPLDITKTNPTDDTIESPPTGSLVRDLIVRDTIAQDFTRERAERVLPAAFYETPAKLLAGIRDMSATTSETVAEKIGKWGCVSIDVKKDDSIKTSVEIREFFLLELVVFEGTTATTIPARLKAEVQNGKLVLGVEIIGLDRLREAAFEEACEVVRQATGCPVIPGTPEG